jgi:hypothetical protein
MREGIELASWSRAYPDGRNTRIQQLEAELTAALIERRAAMAEVVKLREQLAREKARRRPHRKGAKP